MHVTRDVPGPRLLPVVGCMRDFLAAAKDMHGFVNDIVRKYGTTVRMKVMDRVVILVMDPDDVQVSARPSSVPDREARGKSLSLP